MSMSGNRSYGSNRGRNKRGRGRGGHRGHHRGRGGRGRNNYDNNFNSESNYRDQSRFGTGFVPPREETRQNSRRSFSRAPDLLPDRNMTQSAGPSDGRSKGKFRPFSSRRPMETMDSPLQRPDGDIRSGDMGMKVMSSTQIPTQDEQKESWTRSVEQHAARQQIDSSGMLGMSAAQMGVQATPTQMGGVGLTATQQQQPGGIQAIGTTGAITPQSQQQVMFPNIVQMQQIPVTQQYYMQQIFHQQLQQICAFLTQRMGLLISPQLALTDPRYQDAVNKLYSLHSGQIQLDLHSTQQYTTVIAQLNNSFSLGAQMPAQTAGMESSMEVTAPGADMNGAGASGVMITSATSTNPQSNGATSGSSSPQDGSVVAPAPAPSDGEAEMSLGQQVPGAAPATSVGTATASAAGTGPSAGPNGASSLSTAPTSPPSVQQFGPQPTVMVQPQTFSQMTPQQQQAAQVAQQQQQVMSAVAAAGGQQYVMQAYMPAPAATQAQAASFGQMMPTHVPQQQSAQQSQALAFQQQQLNAWYQQQLLAQQQQQQHQAYYAHFLQQQQAAQQGAMASGVAMQQFPTGVGFQAQQQPPQAQPLQQQASNPMMAAVPGAAAAPAQTTIPQTQPVQQAPGAPNGAGAANPAAQRPAVFGAHLVHSHETAQPTPMTSGFDLSSTPYTPSQPTAASEIAVAPLTSFTPGGEVPGLSPLTGRLNPDAVEFEFHQPGYDDATSPSQLNPTASVFQPTSTAAVRTASISSLQAIEEVEDEQEDDGGVAADFDTMSPFQPAEVNGGPGEYEEEKGEESPMEDGVDEVDVVEEYPATQRVVASPVEEQQQTVNGTEYSNFSDDEDADFLTTGNGEYGEEDDYDDYEGDRDEMTGCLVEFNLPPYDIGELLEFRTHDTCQKIIDNFGMDQIDRRTQSKLRCDKSIIAQALQAMDAELPMHVGGGGRRRDHDRGGQSWRDGGRRRPPMRKDHRRGRGKQRRGPATFLPPSASGYSVRREVDRDELEVLRRKIRSLLNKITPERFDLLAERMQQTIDELVKLREHFEVVLEAIIDVSILQPVFAEQYAQLCCHLSSHLVPVIQKWEWVRKTNQKPAKIVRWLVMKTCEARHQMYFNEAKQDGEITAESRAMTKRNLLGTMAIIGELYNKKLMSEKIVHMCIIQPTLRIKAPEKSQTEQTTTPNDPGVSPIEMEAVCRLLTVCGGNLDSEKARNWMDLYFKVLKNESKSMENRIKFMVMDISDLRSRNWRAIMKKEKPKKLNEVRAASEDKPSGRGGSQDARRGRGNSYDTRSNRVRSTNGTSGRGQKRYQIAATKAPKQAWTAKGSKKSGKSSRSNGRSPASETVVEDPETPRRGSDFSRQSSVTSDGSFNSAVDDGTDLKEAEQADVNTLKQQAHGKADEYFSSHSTEGLVGFYSSVNVENKSIILMTMLNRIFCNKKPEDFLRLPKLFRDLIEKNCITKDELLKSLTMLTETFDEDSVDAPRLPWILAEFVSNAVEDELLDLSQFIDPCQANLSGKNFCKFVVDLVEMFENNENGAALGIVQSRRIQLNCIERMKTIIFKNRTHLKQYFE